MTPHEMLTDPVKHREIMEDCASFSNFAQKMKMLLWEASGTREFSENRWFNELPNEKELDDIALELWEMFKNKTAP